MSKMAKDATVEIVPQPVVMSVIASELTKCDNLLSPVAKAVQTTIRQEVRKVNYVEKKDPKMEVNTPSTSSSNPSNSDTDSDSSNEKTKSKLDQ